MTTPLEHDYIGLTQTPKMEASSEKISSSFSSTDKNKNSNVLNLKETELRLGLPGSVSPERRVGNGVPVFGKVLEDSKVNGYASVCSLKKRGFSDAIDGSGKWALSINTGSRVDLAKVSVLCSPRDGNGGLENNNGNKSCLPVFSVKETSIDSTTLKCVEEKKSYPLNPTATASKAQVVGWPPVKSFRKNIATNIFKNTEAVEGNSSSGCTYVKVSMDGAPYLRKVDLKTYCDYAELSSALEKMFSCFTIGQCTSKGLAEREGLSASRLVDLVHESEYEREGLSASRLVDLVHESEYVLTYEDKDGDWMLVGDVPWDMFTDSCKRLRIMKGSEAIGLAPRAMEKCRSRH